MLLQMVFVGFILVVVGSFICLAVVLDPNVIPNPSRQRLLPLGLAMLLAGVGSLCSVFSFEYFGELIDSYLGAAIGGIGFLGGYVLGGLCGAVIGYRLGRMRNKKLTY